MNMTLAGTRIGRAYTDGMQTILWRGGCIRYGNYSQHVHIYRTSGSRFDFAGGN